MTPDTSNVKIGHEIRDGSDSKKVLPIFYEDSNKKKIGHKIRDDSDNIKVLPISHEDS